MGKIAIIDHATIFGSQDPHLLQNAGHPKGKSLNEPRRGGTYDVMRHAGDEFGLEVSREAAKRWLKTCGAAAPSQAWATFKDTCKAATHEEKQKYAAHMEAELQRVRGDVLWTRPQEDPQQSSSNMEKEHGATKPSTTAAQAPNVIAEEVGLATTRRILQRVLVRH